MVPRLLDGVRVRVSAAALTLPGGRQLTEWLTATQDEVLIEQAGIRMLVRGTEEVLVNLDEGSDIAMLGPMLYGSAVRALLLHAGIFCLHATVIRQGPTVIALAGHSGAGKSTTAAALARFHGAALLVDDLVPARVLDGRPQVQVFERPVHLTVEAVDGLGLHEIPDTTTLTPGPRGKVAIPAARFGATADSATWIGLDVLVALSRLDHDPDDDCRRRSHASTRVTECAVSGADRLRWIVRLSNVTGLSSLGDRNAKYFQWAAGLADTLNVVHLVRPSGADTLGEVCAGVLAISRAHDAGVLRRC